MWRIVLVFISVFITFPTNVIGDVSEFRGVEYVRNYDGDTIIVNLIGLPTVFGFKIPVRFSKSDAPEIKGKTDCEKKIAIASRDEVKRALVAAKIINLKNVVRDKYFRIVADVEFDGENLSTYLISKKLAIAYDGRTKRIVDWCNLGRRL
jgi:endonuclease YncB( thermonuclease family)